MTSSWDPAIAGMAWMNSQIRAASTIPAAAAETAPDSSFTCPGCGYRFAGRMTAACTCQYCGHRFPVLVAEDRLTRYGSRAFDLSAPQPSGPVCWGPHPPGLPWPCGCRFQTRYGSLAGIPEPLPPPVYGSYDWPEPPPGPPRPCAGCGLEDHMPWPAGPGALCAYCAELLTLAAPRQVTGSDLARWLRMRDLVPRPGDLIAAAAIAAVILASMGAYTAAAVLIVILSVVAVIQR
jgi:hypothetical protein